LKSIEIDMEKLHMKFSAWNVNFDGQSLDFLGSRKPEPPPHKSRYFTVVRQSFVKTVADKPEYAHAAYHNRH